MNKLFFLKAVAIAFTIGFFIPFNSIAQQKAIAIQVASMYNSETNKFVADQVILIEGDKVKDVGPAVKIPQGAQVIKLAAGTATPGLIDAHTHLLTNQKLPENLAVDAWINSPARRVLRGAAYAREYLNSGFTAIRDLGNSGYYLDMELVTAIRRGYVKGPQMFGSGPIISAIDGQFYQLPYDRRQKFAQEEYRVVKGADDAVQAVKEHVNNSVDVIKIVAFGERLGLEPDEMKAIVKTAHAYGLKVTAHSTGGPGTDAAIAAGVDGIEHAYDIPDSTLRKMAAKNIYMVPTDPSINMAIQMQKSQGQTKHDTAAIRKELGSLYDRLLRAKKAKVMIVAGSDAYIAVPMTRGDAAKEGLVAYVEAGLSPEETLQTATINAAKALGQDGRLGLIKPGVKANLVLFNGDMKKDFRKSLFDVQMVIQNGKIVYAKDQPDLN